MLMYKDVHVTKWVVSIKTSLENICQEGFLIPIYVMFFCEISSYNIIDCKRNIRIRQAETALASWFLNNTFCHSLVSLAKRARRLKRIPWYHLCTQIYRRFMLFKDRWQHSQRLTFGNQSSFCTPLMSCFTIYQDCAAFWNCAISAASRSSSPLHWESEFRISGVSFCTSWKCCCFLSYIQVRAQA